MPAAAQGAAPLIPANARTPPGPARTAPFAAAGRSAQPPAYWPPRPRSRSPRLAAILAPVGGFPLIVFAHGECKESEHYKKWYQLPARLARCGYVVVVPELPGIIAGDEAPEVGPDLALLWGFINWMRTEWEHRQTLMPAPFTGVAGHSHGGGLAAALVTSNPGAFKAFASLSGITREPFAAIAAAPMPKLFMWGTRDAPLLDLNPTPESSEWA